MLKVFVSHRHEDFEQVRQFCTALIERTGTKVTYFISEKIRAGKDWRETILKNLDEADWFFLIFKDPSRDYDWCLYEASRFEANKDARPESKKRLICIHPKGMPRPPPIAPYHSTEATEEGLSALAKELLQIANPQLLEFDDRAHKKLGKELYDAILGKPEIYYEPYGFTLLIPQSLFQQDDQIPTDAVLTGDVTMFRELFGLLGIEHTWRDIDTAMQGSDRRWIRELTNAVIRSKDRKNFVPIQAPLIAVNGHTAYRPVITEVNRTAKNELQAHILFFEDISNQFFGVDDAIVTLFAGIQMAIRFRHELIDPFYGKVQKIEDREKPKRTREMIRTPLFNILTEAHTQGLRDDDRLVKAFEKKEDLESISAFYENWEQISRDLFAAVGMSIEEEVWTKFSDDPIGEENIKIIDGALAKVRTMNSEFLRLSSRRLAELLTSSYGE